MENGIWNEWSLQKNDSGKGGPHSKSDENNPDFHAHCNIQCQPGEDCQIQLKHSKEVKSGQLDEQRVGNDDEAGQLDKQRDDDDDVDVDDDDDDDDDYGVDDDDDEDEDDVEDDDDDDEDEDEDEDEDFNNKTEETNPKRMKQSMEDENYDNEMGPDQQDNNGEKNDHNDKDIRDHDDDYVRNDDRDEGNDGETNAKMRTEDAADTFSSDYIRRKRDIRETDESASQSEPKKEDYDEKVGNLNNQNMDFNIRQAKGRNIIGKKRKHPSLLAISTLKPNIYITEAEKYRRETRGQAPTSMIPAAKVMLSVPMELPENTASKYCKLFFLIIKPFISKQLKQKNY